MRNFERRDDGRSYHEYLKGLAEAEGLVAPTREQRARLDWKRQKKMSDREWKSPVDPDARLTKLKDGACLAHRAEHAVDLTTGAIVAIQMMAAAVDSFTTGDSSGRAAVILRCMK